MIIKDKRPRNKQIGVSQIVRFFGLRNRKNFLLKGIKVPPATKLEWLEEIRKSICELPLKRGRQVIKELKNIY